MKDYEFTLNLHIEENKKEEYIENLGEKCNDSLCLIGIENEITLEFIRKSISKEKAIESAITDIRDALGNIEIEIKGKH